MTYNYTIERLLNDTGIYLDGSLNVWFAFSVLVFTWMVYLSSNEAKLDSVTVNTTDTTTTYTTITDTNLSNITVFGMTGLKRSGKDTCGKRLVDNHGFVRVAFADSLKEACIEIFGFSKEQVYGDDLKEVVDDYWGYSPREVLQKVGTELFRKYISYEDVLPKIGKDIWIRTVERKIINLAKQGYTKFVVTDVRYPNELEFLNNSEFKTKNIKIQRPSLEENENSDETKLHVSEAFIKSLKCDHEIVNNGTIDELYQEIDQIALSLND